MANIVDMKRFNIMRNGVCIMGVYASDEKAAYAIAQDALRNDYFFEERVGVKPIAV